MKDKLHYIVVNDEQLYALKKLSEGFCENLDAYEDIEAHCSNGLEECSSSLNSAVKNAIVVPSNGFETSVDPPMDKETWAAFSIVPAIGLEQEEDELNRKRIAMSIAFTEVLDAFKNPALEIGGLPIRQFLQDTQMRRDYRVGKDGDVAGIGMRINGFVDSVLYQDYVNKKRSDICTVHIIEADKNGGQATNSTPDTAKGDQDI